MEFLIIKWWSVEGQKICNASWNFFMSCVMKYKDAYCWMNQGIANIISIFQDWVHCSSNTPGKCLFLPSVGLKRKTKERMPCVWNYQGGVPYIVRKTPIQSEFFTFTPHKDVTLATSLGYSSSMKSILQHGSGSGPLKVACILYTSFTKSALSVSVFYPNYTVCLHMVWWILIASRCCISSSVTGTCSIM